MKALAALTLSLMLLLSAGCSSDEKQQQWVEDEVSFDADGLTIHGTYRHQKDAAPGPAALLISESGNTDRNGDNIVVGKIGNMRQLAELLSDRGEASLRYDKVGTGKTGLGPYQQRPTDVGSAVYTTGAKAAAGSSPTSRAPTRPASRCTRWGRAPCTRCRWRRTPRRMRRRSTRWVCSQPLSGRYLDIITNRVRSDASPETLNTWLAAVDEVRTKGTVPANLPEGLGAILNPGNAKAIEEADKIDPVALAAEIPAATPALLTCSDTDRQALCNTMQPLIAALKHTALTVVELKGVNHVLRDDPTDNIANLAKEARFLHSL